MNLREKKRPVDWPKQGLYFCLHYKIKCEYTHNIDERWDYQCAEKSYHELPVRLSAMRPVKGELPAELIVLGDKLHAERDKLHAAQVKHYAAWTQLYAAEDKGDTAEDKGDTAEDKGDTAVVKLHVERAKLHVERDKLNGARAELNGARIKYDAALIKYAPEIDALFTIECADVPWGGDGLIFPKADE